MNDDKLMLEILNENNTFVGDKLIEVLNILHKIEMTEIKSSNYNEIDNFLSSIIYSCTDKKDIDVVDTILNYIRENS